MGGGGKKLQTVSLVLGKLQTWKNVDLEYDSWYISKEVYATQKNNMHLATYEYKNPFCLLWITWKTAIYVIADTSFGPKCNNISLCSIKFREMQNLCIP